MDRLFQVVVQDSVPVTAGHLSYEIAREVADGMAAERHLTARIIDESTQAVVYTVEPFAENIIPIRPGIRPQGVENGA